MVAATVGPRLVDANLTLTSSGIMLVEEILYFMDLRYYNIEYYSYQITYIHTTTLTIRSN